MKWRSLNDIVESVLIQRGYSVHWYCQILKYACDGLRELHYDALKNIRTVKLERNSYGSITLPCDFHDWVKIGLPTGQHVYPLTSSGSISRLNNYDSAGQRVVYNDIDAYRLWDEWTWGIWGGWWTYNFGDLVGMAGPGRPGTFKVLRERGEIQFSEWMYDNFIILEYISDGSESDNMTQIHPYAQKTIESYIFWKLKAHNRSYSPSEVQQAKFEYDDQYRDLRGRLSPLTLEFIKAIVTR